MKQVICDNFPSSSGYIIIEGTAHRHLAIILRKKLGEQINLRVPSGELLKGEIVEISKNKIVCKVLSTIEETPYLPLSIVLLQWELKGDKMDSVIRSATEIGVRYIMPVIGCYSVPRTKNEKEKVRREIIVRSAREQSGSPIDTSVFESMPLHIVLEKIDDIFEGKKLKKLVAYENAEIESLSVFSSIQGDEEAIVVGIGAEGGISEDECSLLKKHGFRMLYFAGNILRAETASVYALSSLREAYIEKNRSLR